MNAAKINRYYDEFSQTYEDQRHAGYHQLLDDLEIEDFLEKFGR